MKRRAAVAGFGVGMLMLTAAPVEGQLFNFPDYAVPSSDGVASTFVATSYGRGLNDDAGKLNSVSAMVGRSMSDLSFQGGEIGRASCRERGERSVSERHAE